MSALARIAYFQNRRDEVPNQTLARDLAETADADGIHEIVESLGHRNKAVCSDCLKVLYEIGFIKPELIADSVGEFLTLLKSKDNRMVWGAMIALATSAGLHPTQIWERIDDVIAAVDNGSVITVVWGVRTLARVGAVNLAYRDRIFPLLLHQLQICIPRDLPTHAESMAPIVDATNRQQFISVLANRQSELSASQSARMRRLLKSTAEMGLN